MPSDLPNNPAEHILRFIDKSRQIRGDISVRDAWATLFGLGKTDVAQILIEISNVVRVAERARETLMQLKSHKQDIYLPAIDKVVKALANLNPLGQWSDFQKQIDDSTIIRLQACSDVLDQYIQKKDIDQKVIEDVLKQIEKIWQEIKESDFPEDLKRFFFEHLEKLRRALRQYEIFGEERLKDTLESISGAMLFKYPNARSFWNSSPVKQLLEMLSIVANILQVKDGFQALAEGLQNFPLIGGK